MFSRLRNRFGIPGVISVIALVFAMIGGAYAANDSSEGSKASASAKAKKGPRGPRGPKGPTGPAGPVGPAGAQGSAGAQGPKGDTGAAGAPGLQGLKGETGPTGATGATGDEGEPGEQGEIGPEGSPWTLGGTIPPGKTITGGWFLDPDLGGVSPSQVGLPALFSFPLPMPSPIPDGNIHLIHGDTVPSGCTGGTRAEPKADPGHLCIWSTAWAGPPSAPVQFINMGGPGGTTGFAMSVSSEAGVAIAFGTWAATAPVAP